MKIGVVGMGVVGGTTASILSKVHKIYPYDKYVESYKSLKNLDELAQDSEAVFICVPTPVQKDRSIDYSPIHNSIGILLGATYKVGRKPEDLLIIIRSTAVSGTTNDLAETYPFRFAFNPEFLREKSARIDMENTNKVIIGVNSEEDAEKIREIYEPLFPHAKYVVRDRKTAEFDKYASNVMLASQALFANILYDGCEANKICYQHVKDDILLDERIGRNIEVPGPDGFRGVGGKCFPKDFNAFIHHLKKEGARPSAIKVLEALWEYNEELRGKEGRDWERIPGATSENKDFSKDKDVH